MPEENKMKEIFVDRLVINIGTGSEKNTLANARKLLEVITARKPSNSYSKKRNPAFKIVKGQQIGTFVTIRGDDITPLAKRLLDSVENKLRSSCVTNNSVSFGVREYIDISGVKYDPKIGMLGMNVNLSFKRKGERVSLRKRKRGEIPAKHRIIPKDIIKNYMQTQYKIEFI
ncbi:MAG: 50S ribosomal protein L5 [Candidatus Micrarchaeales archaeon]